MMSQVSEVEVVSDPARNRSEKVLISAWRPSAPYMVEDGSDIHFD